MKKPAAETGEDSDIGNDKNGGGRGEKDVENQDRKRSATSGRRRD